MQTAKADVRGPVAARRRALSRGARSLGECRECRRARVRGASRPQLGRLLFPARRRDSSSGHSRDASPACAFRSARASAAPRPSGARRSSSPTCTSSPATSPAMRPRTPKIVVPLLAGERLIGVLDLDSPRLGRFTAADAPLLEPSRRSWSPPATGASPASTGSDFKGTDTFKGDVPLFPSVLRGKGDRPL